MGFFVLGFFVHLCSALVHRTEISRSFLAWIVLVNAFESWHWPLQTDTCLHPLHTLQAVAPKWSREAQDRASSCLFSLETADFQTGRAGRWKSNQVWRPVMANAGYSTKPSRGHARRDSLRPRSSLMGEETQQGLKATIINAKRIRVLHIQMWRISKCPS